MFRAPKGKWKTLKKEMLNISDLEDQHLINCINMVTRNLEDDHYESCWIIWEMETEYWLGEEFNAWGTPPRPATTEEAKKKLEELKAERARRGV